MHMIPDPRLPHTALPIILLALLISTILLHLIAAPALAGLPDWARELDLDPAALVHEDATVCVLLDLCRAELSDKGELKLRCCLATQVLKPSGADQTILKLYKSPFREVGSIKGWVLRAGGDTEKLSKKRIVEWHGIARGYYSDSQTIFAGFEDIEPGDTVFYEFEIKQKSWFGTQTGFTFQGRQPVKRAEYRLRMPDDWSLEQHLRGNGIEYRVVDGEHLWTLKDSPYRVKELRLPPWGTESVGLMLSFLREDAPDQLQFPDWNTTIAWYAELDRDPAVPDATIEDAVRGLTADVDGIEAQVRAIAAFVRDEIRYVAVELGKGAFIPRDAPVTLANRFGDCKDKTTLMRAMLQVIGVPAYSVMVKTSSPVEPDWPTPFQFNHVIVGIPLDELPGFPAMPGASSDGWLFFDPTDPATRFGDIGPTQQGGLALIATVTESGLRTLPRQRPEDYARRYFADLHLGYDGSVTGRVTIAEFGVLAMNERHYFQRKPVSEQIEIVTEWLSPKIPGVRLSDYTYSFAADTTSSSFTIACDSYAPAAGSLHILRLDPFLGEAPIKLRRDTRHAPIWFGRPMEVGKEITWHLPASWVLDSKTPEFDLESDIGSLHCTSTVRADTLHFSATNRRNGVLIPSTEYDAARDFERALSQVSKLSLLFKNAPGQ